MIFVSGISLERGFFETDRYQLYGFGAVVDLLNGTNWEQSGIFPRVSLCDFQVFVPLLLLTVGSFLYWLFVFVFPWPNRRFISQHLEMWKVKRNAQHIDEENQEMVDTRDEFRTFTDPVAPVYLIVGRPGNAEEMEKLHPVPMLQRITYYNRFSFTLLHFPVDVTIYKFDQI
ncbi:hypothetical protein niasHT_019115 [Heterodera trifolii]|uniref:Uncharacterized protein n=1 Tax=Heterodera trifolii TaxID=157864 RepID=A0ABD2KY90_9BILA